MEGGPVVELRDFEGTPYPVCLGFIKKKREQAGNLQLLKQWELETI